MLWLGVYQMVANGYFVIQHSFATERHFDECKDDKLLEGKVKKQTSSQDNLHNLHAEQWQTSSQDSLHNLHAEQCYTTCFQLAWNYGKLTLNFRFILFVDLFGNLLYE